MIEKIFSKDEWLEAVRGLSGKKEVFVPVKEGETVAFKPLKDGLEIDFDTQKTDISAKSTVYPQSERMFEYSLDENDPEHGIMKESPKDYSTRVVLGVRPCDARAFQILNLNFDTEDYKDPLWINRFNSTVFFGMGCNTPGLTCFCKAVGGSPFSENNLDAMITDLGDSYLVRTITAKGDEVLKELGGKDASGDDSAKAKEIAEKAIAMEQSDIETANLSKLDPKALFEADFWEEVSEGCINCGACTFACPTCWCFDIQDEVRKKEGDRIRNWDSCMFPLFTKHASGHNPRGDKHQRTRQRFMHKLKYFVDKYEQGIMCVGCGRCVEACPVNIDIRSISKTMNNYSG